jgi:hypothetical protein
VAVAAGCSGGGHGGTAQSASTAPVTPPSSSQASTPTADARTQVLEQYTAFWKELTPASLAPASQRRPLLAPFAADPELASLLKGIARDRQAGRVFYGQPLVRAELTQLSESRGVAVVSDCQDATHTGDKDLRTGRLLTKGTARTLVVATLHRSSDSKWRVTFVSFPRRRC